MLLNEIQRKQEQEQLAQALGRSQISEREAQIRHLNSQAEGQWGQAFAGVDENGEPAMFQQHKLTGKIRKATVDTGESTATTPTLQGAPNAPAGNIDLGRPDHIPEEPQQQPKTGAIRPFVKPTKPTPDPIAVHAANRAYDLAHPLPQQSTNIYLPSVDPATGQTVYSVAQSKGAPNIKQTETLKPQGAGGLATGSQTSVADMEQRLGEIKQHATNLAQGKGDINRAMQTREGLEYGIANQLAGGKKVPITDILTSKAMDLVGAGGGPGNATYDDYAALMNSTRALGDDVAKVFKGRQNEEAVLREVSLAQLTPGDFKNPQVVQQKLSRLQNIIDLAKVTQPRTGGAAAPTKVHPVVSKYGITPP